MISAARIMAVVAALAAFTSAQGSLPTCAQSCVTQFTTGGSIGGCNSLDIKCICSSKQFISGIACCLEGKCDAADQQTAISYAGTFCAADGVTVPTALAGLCTSTSSAASGTASPSSSSAAAATTPSSSISTSGSSVTSSASSVSSSVSSSASSVSSSILSSASKVSSSVSSAAASSSASSAAASATKNASPHNVAGLGAGVVGGLAAAVALL